VYCSEGYEEGATSENFAPRHFGEHICCELVALNAHVVEMTTLVLPQIESLAPGVNWCGSISGGGALFRAGIVPTFGLWYDFRQRPPLGDYARLYAECFEEIEEAERLGYAGVWLSEHHFVDDASRRTRRPAGLSHR
jgi:hypothetical protein